MDGTILNKKYDLVERVKALEEGGGYNLPIASDETLGGVKIGEGLSITEEGVLSANAPTPYTPPAYSTTETNTGQKWIDGRDVYRIVYDNIALTNNTDVVVDGNFGNTKEIVSFNCITKIASGTGKIQRPIQSLVIAGNDYAFPQVLVDSLNIVVHGNWTGEVATLIVDYVKTDESKNKKKK